ncbi:MAG: hypothetical protein ACK5KK_05955, partial [Microbacterium sp.]
MSVLVHVVILALLFLLMGVLTTPPHDPEKWRRLLSFVVAIALALALMLFGFVIVVTMLLVYTAALNALGVQVGVLLGTLVVVVAGGVALFLIARPVMHQLRVTHE